MNNSRDTVESKNKVYKNQDDMPIDCPPKDAIEQSINPVYRFLEGNKIQEIDFLNHLEANRPYGNKCDALAISFFTSLESLHRIKKRYKRFKQKKILIGKIESNFGKSNINNQHVNLWVYQDVVLLDEFEGKVMGNYEN